MPVTERWRALERIVAAIRKRFGAGKKILVQRMDLLADRPSTGILARGQRFCPRADPAALPQTGGASENQLAASPHGMVFGVPESTRPPPGPCRVKRLTRPD